MQENGATVYVVFGVKDFHWSSTDIEHVMSDDTVSDTFVKILWNFVSCQLEYKKLAYYK